MILYTCKTFFHHGNRSCTLYWQVQINDDRGPTKINCFCPLMYLFYMWTYRKQRPSLSWKKVQYVCILSIIHTTVVLFKVTYKHLCVEGQPKCLQYLNYEYFVLIWTSSYNIRKRLYIIIIIDTRRVSQRLKIALTLQWISMVESHIKDWS